jgi:hypothetical protein
MARVSPAEGIRYGIGLLGYTLAVTIFGLLIFVVGIALIYRQSIVLGAILFLAGGVATYAGFAGTLYKVISDAVAKGNEISGSPSAQKVSAQTNSEMSGSSTAAKVPTQETTTQNDDVTTTATKVEDPE